MKNQMNTDPIVQEISETGFDNLVCRDRKLNAFLLSAFEKDLHAKNNDV